MEMSWRVQRPLGGRGGVSNISAAIYRRGWGSVAKYNPIILFSLFYFYTRQCVSGLLFLDHYVINKSRCCGVRPWSKVPSVDIIHGAPPLKTFLDKLRISVRCFGKKKGRLMCPGVQLSRPEDSVSARCELGWLTCRER